MDVDASCAICGAPAFPECPHEGERLELAFDQALRRWASLETLKKWVMDHATNQVISTFRELKAIRWNRHLAVLQTLPCYTVLERYPLNPPIAPPQLHALRSQIQAEQHAYKMGVDEDWRRSCLKYPEILDYYFSLVRLQFPSERDPSLADPRFGQPMLKEPKRIKGRRHSPAAERGREGKRKEKRYSGDRTPPPAAPMAGRYGRY